MGYESPEQKDCPAKGSQNANFQGHNPIREVDRHRGTTTLHI